MFSREFQVLKKAFFEPNSISSIPEFLDGRSKTAFEIWEFIYFVISFIIKYLRNTSKRVWRIFECTSSPNWDMTSIEVEVIRTFLFFYKRHFNYKSHKQNHLTNIQPNIYKKSHLNCPYKPLNCLIKLLKHLEQNLLVTSKKDFFST